MISRGGGTTTFSGDYWEQKCEVILPDRIIKANGEVEEIKEEQTTEAEIIETATEISTGTVTEEIEIDDDER